jgi:predicted lipoprotein with Yx(FWY)xxD motif
MIRSTLIALTVTAALVAGCGDDDTDTSAMKGDDRMAADTAMEKADTAMEEGGDKMEKGAAMEGDAAMKEDAAMSAKRRGAVVKVVRSQFGRVIADRKGEAVYLFDKERGRRSECYGACAVAWPPVLTKGRPRAGKGARAGKLGTTRRRGGRLQVTYAGHPLYYYKDDSPGNILCHDVDEFGGTWLVVMPNGRAAG